MKINYDENKQTPRPNSTVEKPRFCFYFAELRIAFASCCFLLLLAKTLHNISGRSNELKMQH